MKITSDYDDDGRRLSKKEKDYAKNVAAAAGIMFLLKIYGYLWRQGNLMQKVRMVISWILCVVTVNLSPNNLGRYTSTSYSGPESYAEYEQQKEFYEFWFPIAATIWLAFVFFSWYKRYKEEDV